MGGGECGWGSGGGGEALIGMSTIFLLCFLDVVWTLDRAIQVVYLISANVCLNSG